MTYTVEVAVGVLVALIGAQAWCLWRLVGRMRVLPRVEERVSTLVHTVGLLTDTTEACFQSVAARLGGDGASAGADAAGRMSRQRRVLGAARRGQATPEIAAQEELAESEVRLRLHMGRQAATPDEIGAQRRCAQKRNRKEEMKCRVATTSR